MADPADTRRNTRAAIQDFLQRSSMGGSGTGIPMQPTGGRPTPDPTPVQRLGQFLSKVWDTSNQAQALTEQAQYAAPFDLAEQAARLYDENQYAIDSWADPFDGVSKLLGSLVSLENPISWGEGGMDGPTFSEALINRGVPEGLAMMAEFLVPDPTGAGKLDEMIPLLGFVPFLRSLRSNPDVAARISAKVGKPGGAQGFFDDLTDVLGADAAYQPGLGREYFLDPARKPGDSTIVQLEQMDPRMRRSVSGGQSHLRMSEDPDLPGVVYVHTLLNANEPGGAEMRNLMPVLDVADVNQAPMRTRPSPFAHARTSTDGLRDMYSRLGFELGYNGEMIRRPVPLDDAGREAEYASRLERYSRVRQAMEAQGMDPRSFHYYGENGPEGLLGILDIDDTGQFVIHYPDGTVLTYGTRQAKTTQEMAMQIENRYPGLSFLMEDVQTVLRRLGVTAAFDMLINDGVDAHLASNYVNALLSEMP